jgi:hypothetical protein
MLTKFSHQNNIPSSTTRNPTFQAGLINLVGGPKAQPDAKQGLRVLEWDFMAQIQIKVGQVCVHYFNHFSCSSELSIFGVPDWGLNSI